MISERIDADLMKMLAEQLVHYELTAKRAGELALEIQSLQEAMQEAQRLEFDDEPAAFLAYLEAVAR